MQITNTNGNARNGIHGSRITIATDNGTIIDRFEVPAMHQNAQQYCQRHPAGRYGQRYQQALQKALAAEAQK